MNNQDLLSLLIICQHRETIQRILTNGEVWSGGMWAKEKGEPKIRGKKDERNALKTHVPVLNKFWEADRICQVNFHGVLSQVKSHTHFCISLVIIDILRYILKVILIQFNLLNCTLSITLDTLYIIHIHYLLHLCFHMFWQTSFSSLPLFNPYCHYSSFIFVSYLFLD